MRCGKSARKQPLTSTRYLSSWQWTCISKGAPAMKGHLSAGTCTSCCQRSWSRLLSTTDRGEVSKRGFRCRPHVGRVAHVRPAGSREPGRVRFHHAGDDDQSARNHYFRQSLAGQASSATKLHLGFVVGHGLGHQVPVPRPPLARLPSAALEAGTAPNGRLVPAASQYPAIRCERCRRPRPLRPRGASLS